MSSVELDPIFTKSLKLLHSKNDNSADQLRSLIDDVIRQKYGPSKMLSNVLCKKKSSEETNVKEQTPIKKKISSYSNSSSTKHVTKISKSNSPKFNQVTKHTDSSSDDEVLYIKNDLTCVKCNQVDFNAKNKLVECMKCHCIYHQNCHVPHIRDSQIDLFCHTWNCIKCTNELKSAAETNVKERTPIKKKNISSSLNTSSTKHAVKINKNNSPITKHQVPKGKQMSSCDDEEDSSSYIKNDLICVKCNQVGVNAKNKLVECKKCHCIYHQTCHFPPIQDWQIDRFRNTWNCCKCTNEMLKTLKESNFSNVTMEAKLKLKKLDEKEIIKSPKSITTKTK